MKLIIDIHKKDYQSILNSGQVPYSVVYAIMNGTPLPKGHGRIGDLDELEQRISNFFEHNTIIADEYTVARLIVEDIRKTPTIIEANGGENENSN